MNSVRRFKKIALDRLKDGRLIKRINEYIPNDSKLKNLLENNKDDQIVQIILQNLTYFGFDETLQFLMQGFGKLFKDLGGKPYTLVFNSDQNKSDLWTIFLLLRYGRIFMKDLYRDPEAVLELSKTDPDYFKTQSLDMVYVFCDDAIYSGTQMGFNINYLDQIYNDQFKFRKHVVPNYRIVCAIASTHAIIRFRDKLFYGNNQRSLEEIIKESKEYTYSDVKTMLRSNPLFPQPYIDKIDYMKNMPIYLEHKMPDTMSSFPLVYIQVVNKCQWNNAGEEVDGSNDMTLCAHPFYKVSNPTKGSEDVKGEHRFIECVKDMYCKSGGVNTLKT